MAVDLDDSGINHGVFHVRFVGARLEKPKENIGFDPITIPLEGSVPVAEKARKIAPRAARPCNPQNRFDKAPIIATAATGIGRLPEAMRFHLRPLGVRQNKSFHDKLRFGV